MTHAQTAARARAPRTPDDRLATALRRLRWPVVIAWIIAIVGAQRAVEQPVEGDQ